MVFLGLLIILPGGVSVCPRGQEAPHVVSLAAVVVVEERIFRVEANGFLRFAKRFFGFPNRSARAPKA